MPVQSLYSREDQIKGGSRRTLHLPLIATKVVGRTSTRWRNDLLRRGARAKKLNDGNAGGTCEKYGRSPARLPKEQMT
jgi:hypothetical protein